MEREGFKMPLLIGGATTSAKHTAVKIAPALSRDGHPRQGRIALRRRRGSADAAGAESRAGPRQPLVPAEGTRGVRQTPAAQARALRRGVAAPLQHRLEDSPIAVPAFSGRRMLRDFPAGGDRALHRLVAVLHGLGADRQVPSHPARPEGRRRRRASCSPTPRSCWSRSFSRNA